MTGFLAMFLSGFFVGLLSFTTRWGVQIFSFWLGSTIRTRKLEKRAGRRRRRRWPPSPACRRRIRLPLHWLILFADRIEFWKLKRLGERLNI